MHKGQLRASPSAPADKHSVLAMTRRLFLICARTSLLVGVAAASFRVLFVRLRCLKDTKGGRTEARVKHVTTRQTDKFNKVNNGFHVLGILISLQRKL